MPYKWFFYIKNHNKKENPHIIVLILVNLQLKRKIHAMNKLFSYIFVTIASSLTLTSCLSDSNDTDLTYYTDTAITSFTLGTLNLTNYTKTSDGLKDSTYTTTFSASDYKFDIDQKTQTISNADSLPKGTDVKHVLTTINTANSGTVILVLKAKADGKDSLAYYSSTDSIDYSEPVRMRVYNMLGTAYREYKVSVNAHKESENEFGWKPGSITGYDGLENRQFVTYDGKLYLTGLNDGKEKTFGCNITSWDKADDVPSKAGNVIGSTDKYRYAITNGKLMRAPIGSDTWTEEKIDDDASLLPNESVSFIAAPMTVDPSINNLLIIGNSNGKTVRWSKVEDDGDNSQTWMYYNDDEYQKKPLPYLANMKAVLYGDSIVATGGDFTQVYTSPDWGLTWNKSTLLQLPNDFGREPDKFDMAVDKNNVLYITRDGASNVWFGRLSQLGWTKRQELFTKSRAARH